MPYRRKTIAPAPHAVMIAESINKRPAHLRPPQLQNLGPSNHVQHYNITIEVGGLKPFPAQASRPTTRPMGILGTEAYLVACLCIIPYPPLRQTACSASSRVEAIWHVGRSYLAHCPTSGKKPGALSITTIRQTLTAAATPGSGAAGEANITDTPLLTDYT